MSQPQTNATETVSRWSWAVGTAALLLVNLDMLYWMQSRTSIDGEPQTSTYFDNGLSY